MQQEQKFRVETNYTVVLFFTVYFLYACGFTYILSPIIKGNTPNIGLDFWLVFGTGIILAVFFYGFRPYAYTVDRKTLTLNYHIRPDKEINLMECETICDPVPRFSEIMHRARAIEIYDTARKRHPFYPHERLKFVEAIVRGNKRIHCTVQEYTDVHRATGRKLRKERRKEERALAREMEENDD